MARVNAADSVLTLLPRQVDVMYISRSPGAVVTVTHKFTAEGSDAWPATAAAGADAGEAQPCEFKGPC
jgi:hypothetical protein